MSTYYCKPKAQTRLEKAIADSKIRSAIEVVQKDLPASGYRTMQEYLIREHGIKVGETRLWRIMKENHLPAKVKRKFVQTTMSKHDELVYPNLLPEMTVTDTNQVWVADLTYIRVLAGFVYLAAILDVYSRKVIGWAISLSLDRSLALAALKMAIEKRSPSKEVIHHSDRGAQGVFNRSLQHFKLEKLRWKKQNAEDQILQVESRYIRQVVQQLRCESTTRSFGGPYPTV